MPIALHDRKTQETFTAAPGQTEFALPCRLFPGYEYAFAVTVDGVALAYNPAPADASEFSTAATGDEGLTVTLGGPLAGGESVHVMRVLPKERVTFLPEAGPVSIADLNGELTRIVALAQDLSGEMEVTRDDLAEESVALDSLESRAFRVLAGQTMEPVDKAAFAGKFWVGDAAGNLIPGTGAGVDGALRADLAATGTAARLIGWLSNAAGAVARTVQDFLFGLPPSVEDFGAKGDGETNDTAAINAAFAACRRVRLLDKTYLASQVLIPAKTRVETKGQATIIKQMPGTGPNTPLCKVMGSDVHIDDIRLEGQLGLPGDTGDTSEQNALLIVQANATTGDLRNITIGSVHGVNARGDVLYFGAAAGYTLKRFSADKIYGDNIFRNVVTASGGCSFCYVRAIDGDNVSLYHFDHEPNVGEGPSKGNRVGFIRGRNIGLVSPDAANPIKGWTVGYYEYVSTIGGSTPDYAAAVPSILTFTRPYPVQVRNIESATLEELLISGAPGPAINCIYNAGELTDQVLNGRHWTIGDCCKTTGTTYLSAGKGHLTLNLGSARFTIVATNHFALSGCSGGRVGPILLTTPNTPAAGAGLINNSDDVVLGPVKHVGGTGGSLVSGSTNRVQILGGNFAGDRLCSNAADVLLDGVVSTAATANVNSQIHMVNCSIGGVKYSYRLDTSVYTVSIDQATGNLTVANATVTASGTGFFNTAVGYKVGSNLVLGPRKTGWTVDTGTAKRTANATYAKGATLTASATYAKADIDAIITRIGLIEQALQDWSQKQKALIDDLHAAAGHGLIGA